MINNKALNTDKTNNDKSINVGCHTSPEYIQFLSTRCIPAHTTPPSKKALNIGGKYKDAPTIKSDIGKPT